MDEKKDRRLAFFFFYPLPTCRRKRDDSRMESKTMMIHPLIDLMTVGDAVRQELPFFLRTETVDPNHVVR
jgi:hypothetical protein